MSAATDPNAESRPVSPPRRRRRVPLQVGSTAVRDAALGFSVLALAPAAMPYLAEIARYIGRDELTANLGAYGILLAFGLAGALVVAAFGRLRSALRERPSDLLIGDDGVGVDGGPNAALFTPPLDWKTVNPGHWQVVYPHDEVRAARGVGSLVVRLLVRVARWEPRPQVELRFGTEDDAIPMAYAREGDAGEIDSFLALIDGLRAFVRDAEPTAPTLAVEVMRCARCGAPLAPDAVEQVACASCGARVRVPGEIRDRIRASRDADRKLRRAQRAITTLVAQPSATATNVQLAVSGVALAGLSLGVSLYAQRLRYDGLLSLGELGTLTLVPVAAAVLWSLYAWSVVARRRALQSIAWRWSALAPIGPGAHPRCRDCFAPLPPAREGEIVVRCAYCACDSVLGFDLRPAAATLKERAASLEVDLARHRGGRLRSLVLGALAAAGLVVGVAQSAREVGRVASRRARIDACERGDRGACVAALAEVGADMDASQKRHLLVAACRALDAGACAIVGSDVRMDYATWDKLREGASAGCSAHDLASCRALVALCTDRIHDDCPGAKELACAAGVVACPEPAR